MTVFDETIAQTPYLRVNNRQRNLDFYTQTLGLKLYREENALAFLGGHADTRPALVLEESPSVRTRAVEGPHKLHSLVFKASSGEIAELLARKVAVEQVYQGQEGYAFSALSPEGHLIWLHGEADVTSLVACDYPDLPANPDFTGLSQVSLDSIRLRVTDQTGYDSLLADLNLSLEFIEDQGPDLEIPADETWDLESLEVLVSAEIDLSATQAHFDQLGLETFLNRKETLLVVTLPNQIELWVTK